MYLYWGIGPLKKYVMLTGTIGVIMLTEILHRAY